MYLHIFRLGSSLCKTVAQRVAGHTLYRRGHHQLYASFLKGPPSLYYSVKCLCHVCLPAYPPTYKYLPTNTYLQIPTYQYLPANTYRQILTCKYLPTCTYLPTIPFYQHIKCIHTESHYQPPRKLSRGSRGRSPSKGQGSLVRGASKISLGAESDAQPEAPED